MFKPISTGASRLPGSGIREIANRAIERPDTIRLEFGEPDFPTPAHIAQAGRLAISQGRTRYTPTAGLTMLRELLVEKLRQVNQIQVEVDQVVASSGGVNAIFASILALVNPGDEVLVPNPAWPNYVMQVLASGAQVVEYPLDPVTFQPLLAEIEQRITPRTKAIIVNSPSNPTGAMISQADARALIELAQKHHLYVISDEVYDEIVFDDNEHVPLFPLDPERVIAVYSFSKTFAMTGWRLGYLVAAKHLAATIVKVQEALTSCPTQISQEAGIAALTGSRQIIKDMTSQYQQRRDAVVEELKRRNLYTYTPQGAFYILVNIASSGLDSRRFALGLLDHCGVSVAPGSAFGSGANHTVRLSLASSLEDLQEGVRRIAAYLEQKEPSVHADRPF